MGSPRSASEKPVVWHPFCLIYLSKLSRNRVTHLAVSIVCIGNIRIYTRTAS